MRIGHAAALALPVAFAGLVLGATAANRRDGRGPTVLTEREVIVGVRDDERSVAELWLTWTEPTGPTGAWLTRDALGRLGFDVSVDASAPDAETYYRRQLARRAYVAFEINGPAWQAVLAERERREGAGEPVPQDALRMNGSRMVPVAVDRDAAVLARAYPDPRRHLITRAVVRPALFHAPGEEPYVGGMLFNIDPSRVQVPVEWAAELPVRQFNENQRASFSVSVIYGSRWELWVVGVSRGAASR